MARRVTAEKSIKEVAITKNAMTQGRRPKMKFSMAAMGPRSVIVPAFVHAEFQHIDTCLTDQHHAAVIEL